jgi:hypothetical protein
LSYYYFKFKSDAIAKRGCKNGFSDLKDILIKPRHQHIVAVHYIRYSGPPRNLRNQGNQFYSESLPIL